MFFPNFHNATTSPHRKYQWKGIHGYDRQNVAHSKFVKDVLRQFYWTGNLRSPYISMRFFRFFRTVDSLLSWGFKSVCTVTHPFTHRPSLAVACFSFHCTTSGSETFSSSLCLSDSSFSVDEETVLSEKILHSKSTIKGARAARQETSRDPTEEIEDLRVCRRIPSLVIVHSLASSLEPSTLWQRWIQRLHQHYSSAPTMLP